MQKSSIFKTKMTISTNSLMSSTHNSFRKNAHLRKDSKFKKDEPKSNRNSVILKHTLLSKERKNVLPSLIKTPSSTPQATLQSTNFFSNHQKIQKMHYYIIKPENCGYLIKKCFEHRLNWRETSENAFVKFNFKWQQCNNGIDFSSLSKYGSHKQMVNHFENHYSISNKANLFMNLMRYCEIKDINVFKIIPVTILFNYESQGFLNCFENFKTIFNNLQNFIFEYESLYTLKYKIKKFYNFYFPFEDRLGSKTPISIPTTHYDGKNIWLVKAPDLNRGRCIKVTSSCEKVRKYIKSFYEGILKGYSEDKENDEDEIYKRYKSNLIIVQKYIEKPLLYRGRKFDIRIWVLLTHKGEVYMFKEGHLKACSVNYNVGSTDSFVHLTNYSLQKHNSNFEKYEKGNEISYKEFQHFLDEEHENNNKPKIVFTEDILPKIKKIITIVFQSVKSKINAFDRKYCFEIFGFDFMIDQNYNPFLIEGNTNPGLEESSPLIKMLVPRMLDDALRLTVDDIFKTSYSFYDGDEFLEKYYPYISLFPVTGYFNTENLWVLLCDLQKDEYTNRKSNVEIRCRAFSSNRLKRRKTFW